MSQTLKNLLVFALFISLVVLGYFMFTQRNSGGLAIVGGTTVSVELLARTRIFIERRAALQSLNLDTSLFTNPAFTSLRSYTSDVPDQSIGRDNIFDTAQSVSSSAP